MDNIENYLNFEHYCINKHFKDYNQLSYHWSNIPDEVLINSNFVSSEEELRQRRKYNKNKNIKEYGLDGISVEIINNNKIYNGIQCKLWNNTICANHLGTFLSVIHNRFNDNSKGYLYHTCKLEKTLKKDLLIKNKIIPINIKNFNNNNIIKEENEKLKLRQYQLDALKKLSENWTGIKSLILPCGCGKTIIFSEYVKKMKYKNIFIFSPLKILTEQNLNRVKNYLPEYNSILIDTDGTRNLDDIKNNINKYTIFSSTYKSAENIIYKLFDDEFINSSYKLLDTILIVDEAHNLYNRENLIKIIKLFEKVLLVTATPYIKMNEIIGSDIIFKYNFKDAIKDKYICDYQLYLPYIEKKK